MLIWTSLNDTMMLTTIEGIYENGHIIFKETPPLKKKAKVLITFIEDNRHCNFNKKRPLGTIKMSDNFNDPIDNLKDYM